MKSYKEKVLPIGLVPEHIWKIQRFEDVKAAIQRYKDANFPVPDEWVDEYSRLKKELHLE
jgi:hypothetical protein